MIKFLDQANHCLNCKNARCQKHCPINTPIPKIISLYKENKLQEAGEILFENNPLTSICAIVCPHEDQCRGNCIRGIKGEPVRFHDIEVEVSRAYLENLKLTKPESNGKKIAIIGSGPAGLTAAFELSKKGYQVTIFEKNERIGGILTYGIPSFRLPKDYIELIHKHLLDLGVKIKINSLIGPIITIEQLKKDGYEAIFIATGVWNPRKLNIEGETLSNVHYAIDYLRSPAAYDLGDNVIVIGAGNVAMDASRSAKHFGSKNVTICYRRDVEDMPATKDEVREALEDNIKFDTFKAPVKIVEDGIIMADTKKITNADGSVSIVTLENSEKLHKCDSILIAVGQVPRDTIVRNSNSLETSKGGFLKVDDKGQTSIKGVFACGDVAHGASTVIAAVVAAKKISDEIDKQCNI